MTDMRAVAANLLFFKTDRQLTAWAQKASQSLNDRLAVSPIALFLRLIPLVGRNLVIRDEVARSHRAVMICIPIVTKLKRIMTHLLSRFRIEEKGSELFGAMATITKIHIHSVKKNL